MTFNYDLMVEIILERRDMQFFISSKISYFGIFIPRDS